jgi:mRNA-degrading endonuclease toxin of MazEF toxin-antitoxin module
VLRRGCANSRCWPRGLNRKTRSTVFVAVCASRLVVSLGVVVEALERVWPSRREHKVPARIVRSIQSSRLVKRIALGRSQSRLQSQLQLRTLLDCIASRLSNSRSRQSSWPRQLASRGPDKTRPRRHCILFACPVRTRSFAAAGSPSSFSCDDAPNNDVPASSLSASVSLLCLCSLVVAL